MLVVGECPVLMQCSLGTQVAAVCAHAQCAAQQAEGLSCGCHSALRDNDGRRQAADMQGMEFLLNCWLFHLWEVLHAGTRYRCFLRHCVCLSCFCRRSASDLSRIITQPPAAFSTFVASGPRASSLLLLTTLSSGKLHALLDACGCSLAVCELPSLHAQGSACSRVPQQPKHGCGSHGHRRPLRAPAGAVATGQVIHR